MAGGSFSSMNKVIPGIYYKISKQAVQQPLLTASGVLLWIGERTWGDAVERISLDDYSKDVCYRKTGLSNTSKRMELFAQSCQELIAYDPREGRAKASATAFGGKVTLTAAKPGSLGNSISVVIIDYSADVAEVRTSVDGVVQHRQRVKKLGELVSNAWVVFGVEAANADVSAHSDFGTVNLTGGSDGTAAGGAVGAGTKATGTLWGWGPITATPDGAAGNKVAVKAEGQFDSSYSISATLDSTAGAPVWEDIIWIDKVGLTWADQGPITLAKVRSNKFFTLDADPSGSAPCVPVSLSGPQQFSLAGGVDGAGGGAIDLSPVEDEYFNVVVTDDQSPEMRQQISAWIADRCDKRGRYARCLFVDKNALPDSAPDNMYLSLCVNSVDGDDSLTAFALACVEAGASWNESTTMSTFGLDGALDEALSDEDLETAIESGIMAIMKRIDGALCICKDINTRATNSSIPAQLGKNRAVRLVETLRNTLRSLWETQYAGKVHNDETGRLLWKSKVCEVLNEFVAGHGIEQYESDDIIVAAGEKSDEVVMTIPLQFIDSAELVYVNLIL
nr:MAG TPA_asm: tail sheath protein [Caudoviricetes sp.]